MKTFRAILGLLTITWAPICHAHTEAEIEAALASICDRPEALFSPENQKLLTVFAESFPADRLAKLRLPDEAFAWLPPFGPCGGPGSPLLMAFFASAARDEISGRKDQIIYRGWRVVLSHYAYLRKSAPDDFPEIAALEAMARKEQSGVLAKEASALERKKAPNHSPQPTTGQAPGRG